jgi:hypothetical protein
MPSEISRTLTGSKPSLDHETKVLINMIFARFHHIYTHRFESAYRDETTLNQAKREWALSLAGMSANLIELALERCKREHAWPPTIAEFLKLARPTPESLGLPSTDDAYLEACQHSHHASEHEWTHICVQLAARDVGYFTLRSESERFTRPLFEKAYLHLLERLANGETLEVPQPAKALPQPDFKEEALFLEKLNNLDVEPSKAAKLAYYLEKPRGTDLRARYRKHAMELAKGLNLGIDFPA